MDFFLSPLPCTDSKLREKITKHRINDKVRQTKKNYALQSKQNLKPNYYITILLTISLFHSISFDATYVHSSSCTQGTKHI